MANKKTIICMKWGTQYGPEYVNILASMVKRFSKENYSFICFTDDTAGIHSDIETRPIPEIPLGSAPVWSGWRKLACLSPDLDIEGTILFMDIDIVITGQIDPFFDHKIGKFCIIENWTELGRGVGNSSVFRFEAGAHTDVFEHFSENHEKIYQDYTNEQTYLTKMVARNNEINWWPETWCRSFKRHSVPTGPLRLIKSPKLPKGCRILVFHGPPKPADAAIGKWRKDGGKRGKYIKPSPWINDYWYAGEKKTEEKAK